jgi:hypothetical protein
MAENRTPPDPSAAMSDTWVLSASGPPSSAQEAHHVQERRPVRRTRQARDAGDWERPMLTFRCL